MQPHRWQPTGENGLVKEEEKEESANKTGAVQQSSDNLQLPCKHSCNTKIKSSRNTIYNHMLISHKYSV